MLAAAELLPDEGTLRPYFVGLQMFKLVVWRSKVQGSWDMETPPDLRVQAVKDAAPKAPSASAPPSLCAGGAVDTCEVLLQAAPQNDARSDSSPSMEHNAGALRTGQVRSGARGGRVRPGPFVLGLHATQAVSTRKTFSEHRAYCCAGPVVQDADDSERANRVWGFAEEQSEVEYPSVPNVSAPLWMQRILEVSMYQSHVRWPIQRVPPSSNTSFSSRRPQSPNPVFHPG